MRMDNQMEKRLVWVGKDSISWIHKSNKSKFHLERSQGFIYVERGGVDIYCQIFIYKTTKVKYWWTFIYV